MDYPWKLGNILVQDDQLHGEALYERFSDSSSNDCYRPVCGCLLSPEENHYSEKGSLIIATAWFGSAVYCVPLFYYANLLVSNENVFCKTRHFFINWRIWYLFFLSLLVLTLLVVVGLYAAIIIRLWRGERGPRIRMSFRSRTNARINVRVLKMVAMIVFVFYCCILPYWIGWVFCSYYRNDLICSDTYVFVVVFLMYSNSAFNPAIYSFFNHNFRRSFRFILNKLCKCCFTNRALYIQPEPKPIYVIGRGLQDCEGTDKKTVQFISIQNLQ